MNLFIEKQQHSFYSQIQDNLRKLVSESQTMVDFAAARDAGHSSSDKCNSNKTCKAPVKSPPSTYQNPTYHSVDALPVTQPSVRALKALKQTRELQINIYMWIFKELQLRPNYHQYFYNILLWQWVSVCQQLVNNVLIIHFELSHKFLTETWS